MPRKHSSHARFTIRHVLVAIVIAAMYLACRKLALAHLDQRFLLIVAPMAAGLLLSSLVAIGRSRYLTVFLAAVIGPLVALIAWAAEIKLETGPARIADVPTDLASLALVVSAVAVLDFLVSFAFGTAVRFGRDIRVSPAVRIVTLGLSALVLIGLGSSGYSRWKDPAFRYRVLGDTSEFRRALADHVDNGDPMDHVISQLGEGQHRKERSWIEIQMMSMKDPSFIGQYPDGIQIDDTFIAYDDGVNQWCLQFRDGKLINLDKEWLTENYGKR